MCVTHIYIYVCVYIYIHFCVCIYTHTHTHTITLNTCSKEIKIHIHTKTWTWMFLLTAFIVAKNWRQLKCTSMDKQIVVNPYNRILLSKQRNKLLICNVCVCIYMKLFYWPSDFLFPPQFSYYLSPNNYHRPQITASDPWLVILLFLHCLTTSLTRTRGGS